MTYEKLVLLTLIFLVENMEPHEKTKVNSLHRLFFTQDHERLKDGLTTHVVGIHILECHE